MDKLQQQTIESQRGMEGDVTAEGNWADSVSTTTPEDSSAPTNIQRLLSTFPVAMIDEYSDDESLGRLTITNAKLVESTRGLFDELSDIEKRDMVDLLLSTDLGYIFGLTTSLLERTLLYISRPLGSGVSQLVTKNPEVNLDTILTSLSSPQGTMSAATQIIKRQRAGVIKLKDKFSKLEETRVVKFAGIIIDVWLGQYNLEINLAESIENILKAYTADLTDSEKVELTRKILPSLLQSMTNITQRLIPLLLELANGLGIRKVGYHESTEVKEERYKTIAIRSLETKKPLPQIDMDSFPATEAIDEEIAFFFSKAKASADKLVEEFQKIAADIKAVNPTLTPLCSEIAEAMPVAVTNPNLIGFDATDYFIRRDYNYSKSKSRETVNLPELRIMLETLSTKPSIDQPTISKIMQLSMNVNAIHSILRTINKLSAKRERLVIAADRVNDLNQFWRITEGYDHGSKPSIEAIRRVTQKAIKGKTNDNRDVLTS